MNHLLTERLRAERRVREAGPDLLRALELIFETFDLKPDSLKEQYAIEFARFSLMKAKQDFVSPEDLEHLAPRKSAE